MTEEPKPPRPPLPPETRPQPTGPGYGQGNANPIIDQRPPPPPPPKKT